MPRQAPLTRPSTHRNHLPHDRYGLPLTTSADAAVAYGEAHSRLLRVQAGATEPLLRAVRLDPEFALGHATLAALGHEFGEAVDVPASLRRAEDAAGRATERERSFVA